MRKFVLIAAMALAACGQAAAPHGVAGDAGGGAVAAPSLAPLSLPAFFDCLRERSQTIISAHRGGPASGYAENAIPTFEHTLTQTPAFLEVDVGRTRDGALVLMHDDTANRTTNGRGDIDRMTLAEFQALQLRDDSGALLDAHPPTLREALDWAADKTVLELDIKRGVKYEDAVQAVRDAGAMNRVVFITYSTDAAARLARLAPEAMLYVTIEEERDLEQLERRGVQLSHVVAWTGVDEPNSALNVALAEAGVETRFGTLGGTNSWDARFARAHQDQYAVFADTGLQMISTDRPQAALADLDAHDGAAQSYGALQCLSAH